MTKYPFLRLRVSLCSIFVILLLSPSICLSATTDRSDYYRGLDLYHDKNYEAAAQSFHSQLEKTPEDESSRKWLDKATNKIGGRGASQFVIENRPLPNPAPARALAVPPAPEAPLLYAPLSLPTQQNTTPNITPARTAPQDTQAAPEAPRAFVSDQSLKLQGEIQALKQELAMRTDQVTRSIQQTKRALAQTDDAERVNRELSQEIERMRTETIRLSRESAELQKQLETASQKSGPGRPGRESGSALNTREDIATKLAMREAELKILKDRFEKARTQIRELRSVSTDKNLEKARMELDRNKIALQNTLIESRGSTGRIQKALRSKEQFLRAALAREAELKSRLEYSESALKEKSEDRGQIARALEKSRQELEQVQKEKAGALNDLETLNQTHQSLELKLREAREHVSEGEQETTRLRAVLSESTRRLELAAQARVLSERRLEESERLLATITQDYKKAQAELATLRRAKGAATRASRELEEVAVSYQASEDARLGAERRLAEARYELKTTQEIINNSRERFDKTEHLLQESREQGLRLGRALDQERRRRETLEQTLRSLEISLGQVSEPVRPATEI